MLGARSIAVVGASPRPDSFGARMVTEATRGSARVHLVNPRYTTIGDLPCSPALEALDEVPDLVMVGVPDAAVIAALESAAAVGTPSAVLFGSAHADGLRSRIAGLATNAGMAVCGAGCMGFINNALGVRALGYLEPHPLPIGGVTLVTHSGSAFSTVLRARRGFGFRLAVSSGQELVTDTADYVEYALEDPQTTLIALLLETPRSVPRLAAALRRAAANNIPVVILSVGGSPRGRAMVAAHSGALAGDTEGWAAFCAATGAVHVSDMAEFTDTIELFAAGRRVSSGTGIATVHDSGAERALCTDVAHSVGAPFADISDTTTAEISACLDEGLTATNPLDVWGTGADTRALFGRCLQLMSADPAVAVTALAVDLVTEYDGDTAYTDAVLDTAQQTRAPLAVLTSLPSAVDSVMSTRLRQAGVPVLEGYRSGLLALRHLARWPLPLPEAGTAVDVERQRRWRQRIADGHADPLALLADYGIPVVNSRPAASVPEVLHAAECLGYPVALKTVGSAHKSDVGGVVLHLCDADALTTAYTTMAAALGPKVTVDAMVAAGVEISVGVVRDPGFGPLVVVAAGGVLIELVADRVVGCPPLSRVRARGMLDGLRIRPQLDGWRGAAPVDIDAVVDVIVGFGCLAVELGDVIDAVEANPVIATSSGAVAVDVLLITRAADRGVAGPDGGGTGAGHKRMT
ncbi:acetyl-CoA synthetase [Mycobacterium sp. MS1601]|uniref:acetate--CoA ligase family protein n=1 Tax=Mycobacterium sp. MS1601 TaxID=1936029 RepID=UPI000979175C|nr:acetate--CoA ligase family protein [Mycobacterium sp. MS1601]AQA04338.1 acetyl-CoA synthetase [Mycobacterium sp. MS1601]